MNVRENQVLNLTNDFHVEVEIPDGTEGALRIIPGGTTVPTAPLQAELAIVGGAPRARVRINGVWTTI